MNQIKNNPRSDDILETFRRWELARATGFITDEIEAQLKNTDIEHTLLINESGELELTEWEEIKNAFGGNKEISVFTFERRGKSYAVCWHNSGNANVKIPLKASDVKYVEELGGKEILVLQGADFLQLPVDKKRYLITDLSLDELKKTFEYSEII